MYFIVIIYVKRISCLGLLNESKKPCNPYQRNGVSQRHVQHNRHQLYNHIKSMIGVLMTLYIDLNQIQVSHFP